MEFCPIFFLCHFLVHLLFQTESINHIRKKKYVYKKKCSRIMKQMFWRWELINLVSVPCKWIFVGTFFSMLNFNYFEWNIMENICPLSLESIVSFLFKINSFNWINNEFLKYSNNFGFKYLKALYVKWYLNKPSAHWKNIIFYLILYRTKYFN